MHKNNENENQTKIIRCGEIFTIDLSNKKFFHFFSSSGFVRVGQISHRLNFEYYIFNINKVRKKSIIVANS